MGRKPMLSFEELLVKYQNMTEAKTAKEQAMSNHQNCPKRKSQDWNWQENKFYTTTKRPFEQPILKPYGPPSTGLHPYSAWGWFNQGAHVPPYFRPYYVEYATPRYSKESSYCKDCFDHRHPRGSRLQQERKQ
jgi:hypothetical protein